MAAAFLAMNEVFGPLFDVGRAEAQQPEAAAARSDALRGQFVFDDQLHFVRDDYQFEGITGLAKYAARALEPGDARDRSGLGSARYKFENFLKEVFLDSDTRVGLLSGAPFDDPKNWFLTNDQIKQAAPTVNGIAGTRRLLFHSLFTPRQPGWMEEVDRAIAEVRPTSWKGYTIGDPLSPQTTRYPWRLDDEALMYPFYEKAVRAGITTVCIHKGLLPKDYENSIPGGAWRYAGVEDLPQGGQGLAADQLRHLPRGAAAFPGEIPTTSSRGSSGTGPSSGCPTWPRSRSGIGVSNVYAELGTCFAISAVTNPRFCAAMLGTLGQGARGGPRVLGHGLGVVRLAAMADRGVPPARDPGGHAAKARLRRRSARPTAR